MTPSGEPLPSSTDVVIVGAGFGGLAAALRLSELGVRVVLCEALTYPGGCASTFTRNGYRFEAGATLFSGLGDGQLFRRWIERYAMRVDVDWLDPVVELRAPGYRFEVPAGRDAMIAELTAMPGAPRVALARFFDRQKKVADVVWSLMERPELIPPFRSRALLDHALRAPRYLPLLPLLGRTLGSVLASYGVADFAPLRLYLDGLCQITVQCPPSEAEALFALATMDYYFRGTGHVRGGIGELATGLVEATREAGGSVSMANRVDRVEPIGDGFRVRTRRGELTARAVIANVLPQNLWELTDETAGSLPKADALAEQVEQGWGAAMLYRVVKAPHGASPDPHHLELIQSPDEPLVEGNHVFCSFSGERDHGRAPEGYRTLTVSTHIPVAELRARTPDEQAVYIETVQRRMRHTLAAQAPEWEEDVAFELTASPRTFQRFTRRYVGYVGGIPRRAGLHNYRGFGPHSPMRDLYLVGDTVFPGQSTLATSIGGVKLAEHVARTL